MTQQTLEATLLQGGPVPQRVSLRRQVARFARTRPLAGFGGLLILVMVGAAVAAPIVAPYDPTAIDFSVRLIGPSPAHPLGTDQFGRDILSRVLFGAQISLYVGLLATLVGVGLGTIVCVASGYL